MAGTALCAPRAQISWQAQCTEPPGLAAARVVAAGPRLPFVWQAQHSLHLECRFRGRRSTQSLAEQLQPRRAWLPLGRGCRVCVW